MEEKSEKEIEEGWFVKAGKGKPGKRGLTRQKECFKEGMVKDVKSAESFSKRRKGKGLLG